MKGKLLLILILFMSIASSVGTNLEAASSNVATVKIYSIGKVSSGASSNNLGHTWITIKNTTSKTITVGRYNLCKGCTVSAGTFGNKRHNGVYYNLEGYYNNLDSSQFENTVSLSENVTAKELSWITRSIKNNDNWSKGNNCSDFALRIWNYISPSSKDIYPFGVDTPTGVEKKIKAIKGHGTGFSFKKQKKETAYYSSSSKKLVYGTL